MCIFEQLLGISEDTLKHLSMVCIALSKEVLRYNKICDTVTQNITAKSISETLIILQYNVDAPNENRMYSSAQYNVIRFLETIHYEGKYPIYYSLLNSQISRQNVHVNAL